MPVSFLDMTPLIIGEIQSLAPKSVLDVGAGYGTYGHLIRAHVDKYPWKLRLEAIEGFDQYLYRIGNTAYNRVYRMDWEKFWKFYGEEKFYDLILLIDVIEHFEKEEGRDVLDKCKSICKHLLVSTPSNPGEQGPEYGNELEIHRSQWTDEDFYSLGGWRSMNQSHAIVGVYE